MRFGCCTGFQLSLAAPGALNMQDWKCRTGKSVLLCISIYSRHISRLKSPDIVPIQSFAACTLRIDENLKRYRAVSLRQHGFIVFKSSRFFVLVH